MYQNTPSLYQKHPRLTKKKLFCATKNPFCTKQCPKLCPPPPQTLTNAPPPPKDMKGYQRTRNSYQKNSNLNKKPISRKRKSTFYLFFTKENPKKQSSHPQPKGQHRKVEVHISLEGPQKNVWVSNLWPKFGFEFGFLVNNGRFSGEVWGVF